VKRETQLVRGTLPPVDRATVKAYEDATPGQFYYQRSAHPVGVEAERLLSELEGGQALLFPSGMGATTALILALLAPGASVAVADGGYFGTVGLLRSELTRWGLAVTSFDQTKPPPTADLVWLEPCSNPILTFPDLDASVAQAHSSGALVVVDNTALSPLLLRPHEHGADFVLHSASKILQSATALELARRLSGHAAVQCVRYPGLGDEVAARYVSAFGPLLSFDVADAEHAAHVERGLKLIENATSLGGVASTLEARARWEGDRVPPGLLRLSAGLEDVDDLWADLTQALDA